MKPSHYILEASTARHAVLSSSWGETVLIDRRTLRAVYHSGQDGNAALVEALMVHNRNRLDEYAAPLIECCGNNSLTLNALADIRATLGELADVDAVARCGKRLRLVA